jgi:hypothetical protein
LSRNGKLARARLDAALHPATHINERVQLVIDFSNNLLVVCDEFGVLFDAGGGFCFEMGRHDNRILEFFPRGFQASYSLFMIVRLAVAIVSSHGLRLTHDAARRQMRSEERPSQITK